MKTTNKLIALLATLALLCTLWVPTAAATAPKTLTAIQNEETFYFGRSILAQMDNSEALLYAYDQMVSACENLSDHVDISHRTYTLNSDEAFMVWEVVSYDRPEFFWLADGAGVRTSNEIVTSYTLYIPADVETKQAALKTRVAELTADLTDKSDYEKSLILHDRLANCVDYQFTDNDQTVIGSLLEGRSVCAGYARAYQLLMQSVGIPVWIVTGYSLGQGHAWDLVQLDGEWYYTDVTWDDQTNKDGYIYYSYFNMTYETLLEDHSPTDFLEYLPQTTATAANYHTRHDTALDTPNADIIATLFEAGLTIRLYVTGDFNTFISDLNGALYGAADQIACIGSSFSCGAHYMGREIILDLSISRPHNYDANNVCQKCGYQKEVRHHYFITITDPTCGEDGQVIYTCSYCGSITIEAIPATGEHVYETVVTSPDCNNGGYTTYTCIACGDSYTSDVTDALGHNYHSVTTDPTCAEDGEIVYTCSICGDSYSEIIPATGEHIYETVVTSPDCNNGGYTTYTCIACGDSYTSDVTDALGHNYHSVTTDPTCVEDGEIVCTCSICGDSYSEIIPATGEHVYDDDADADCNECGYQRQITLYGDADGNGKINNRDLGLLQLYLNDDDLSGKTFDLLAADLDGNGKVNNRDLGLLQRMLNDAA